ncbi:MAG TPA: DUF6531 domain-containing protein [Kofleriaceae bacterium]|nr:DUF6531 domain-containing protein [Kofleriaceae bacterium]
MRGGPVLMAAVLLAARPAAANVSLKNGNFFIGYTDVIYPGGFEPKIERVYNSKSGFKGMFGWAWGVDWEVYLVPMPDRTVVVHEYGGGAENVFYPADYGAADGAAALDALVAAARAAGEITTPQAEADYRARMAGNPQAWRQSWEGYLKKGKAQPPRMADGLVLVSDRFGHQTVTAGQGGYQRVMDNGRREGFDALGRQVRVWDANGNWVTIGHDPAGRMTSIVDNFGRRLDLSYTPKGFLAAVRADRGRVATYAYDDHDNLVRSRDVDGNAYTYRYDARHNLLAIGYGDKTRMEIGYYPRDGKNENVRRVIDRDGTQTYYSYRWPADGLGITVGVEVFGGDGKKISRSLYDYGEARRSDGSTYTDRMATDIDGDRTETTYNAAGLPLRIARGGEVTVFAYDDKGHATLKDTPTEVTRLTYHPDLGKVTRVERTAKHKGAATTWSTFEYDARGNLTAAEDSEGRKVALTYDGNGRIDTMVDQKGGTLRFTYNSNSKPTVIELVGVGSINVTYLPSGEIKKVDSTAGRKIALEVTSAFQNLLDVIRPAGVELSF